jgi:hypothetical protein
MLTTENKFGGYKMKGLISTLRRISLKKVVVAIALGIFFFTGINLGSANAVSGGSDQAYKSSQDPSLYESKVLDDNATNVPTQRGMNGFSDVDPRLDTRAIDQKAKFLKENAKRNINNATGNVAENARRVADDASGKLDNLDTQDIQEGSRRIAQRAQSGVDRLREGTKKGAENVKENAKDAARSAPGIFKQALENIKGNGPDDAQDLAKRGG